MDHLLKYSEIKKKLRTELKLDGFDVLVLMLKCKNIKSVTFESGSDHSITSMVVFVDGSCSKRKVWWTLESKKVDMDVLLWYATTMAFISEPSVIRTDFATYEVLD